MLLTRWLTPLLVERLFILFLLGHFRPSSLVISSRGEGNIVEMLFINLHSGWLFNSWRASPVSITRYHVELAGVLSWVWDFLRKSPFLHKKFSYIFSSSGKILGFSCINTKFLVLWFAVYMRRWMGIGSVPFYKEFASSIFYIYGKWGIDWGEWCWNRNDIPWSVWIIYDTTEISLVCFFIFLFSIYISISNSFYKWICCLKEFSIICLRWGMAGFFFSIIISWGNMISIWGKLGSWFE